VSGIQPGTHVLARAANDKQLERRAITEPIPGDDFQVVWVCSHEEWDAAQAEGRDPQGIPWPVEDVTLVEIAHVGKQ